MTATSRTSSSAATSTRSSRCGAPARPAESSGCSAPATPRTARSSSTGPPAFRARAARWAAPATRIPASTRSTLPPRRVGARRSRPSCPPPPGSTSIATSRSAAASPTCCSPRSGRRSARAWSSPLPTTPARTRVRQLVERVDRARGLAALDAGLYTEIELGGERAFDSPFWQQRAPSRVLRRVVRNRVPALLISGWFDVYQRGVVLNYAALQNAWAGRRHDVRPDAAGAAAHAALPARPGAVAAQRRGDGGVDPADPPRVVRPLAAREADRR